jgi:hypothetical protein
MRLIENLPSEFHLKVHTRVPEVNYELKPNRFVSVRYSGVTTKESCDEYVAFIRFEYPLGKTAESIEFSYGVVEFSVAAGVAATLIAHFSPQKKDTVEQLVKEVMQARVAAGVQYPSDTQAGFELGKAVALKALEKSKDFLPVDKWDAKIPSGQNLWNGTKPLFPMWSKRKPMVMDSANQFRPGPPPDYKNEMEELKNLKPTFQSMLNAFQWASGDRWLDLIDKKVFEYNLHLNPPRAARINALRSIVTYDAQVACWDAKYTYWGIRPAQYDTTYRPALTRTPNFPGYTSMHAVLAGAYAVLLSDLFPAERDFFWEKAKEAAQSRIEGGIHFRSDNVVGMEMGRKIGELVLLRAREDGGDEHSTAKKK